MVAPTLNVTPAVKRELRTLGAGLKKARILRKLSMELVAKRAGSTRSTLYRIEKGDPNVRIGAYLLVMQALGILNGIGEFNDELGERLATEQLPKRVRQRD
ncbi:MAG: helix-turn-helix domain-containing protein [Alphaproteobacteria bacterium]|jgi:transcriptional regulator with XRE-family HTH domain|nr:helix-turn-helix domain-containing protein [Alphaproteobacteria bacterium]|tara:strand:- start:2106 stop:2408 length:303 start_codon:yes stop_codon:yes gene_type:complete